MHTVCNITISQVHASGRIPSRNVLIVGQSVGLSSPHLHTICNNMFLNTMIFFVNLHLTVSPQSALLQLYGSSRYFI